ncbi:MAG TPA: ATP-binding protein [Oscillospiraceae bacterium]|nr:ATP-binding protein [Oscillospiraceae bacterium]
MTTKIFKSTFLTGMAALLACVALFFGVLYQYFEARLFTELKSEAAYAAQGLETAGEAYFNGLKIGERITWVAADGTVLYDNEADAATMENHADRQEIKAALENGSGQSARYSATFMEKTLYYALRLTDGTVLRVSCTQNTVGTLLLGMLSPLLWILAAVLILSAVLASRLARRITRPINQMELEDPKLDGDYPELTPLVQKLREQNFTIHRQMEELRRKREEFTAITENMSEGFILVDNKAAMLSYNSSALRILDSSPSEEGGSVLALNRSEEFRAAVSEALSGRHGEMLLQLGEGSYQIIANPVTADGQVTGAVLVILDVTEKEQRDALRREFTANVSHELKTPLTSISGFAELIRDGLVEKEKIGEFAGDIYDESRRLIALVEDIIKLSRLDEESFSPQKETVDLKALAAEVIARLQGTARARNVTVTLAGEGASVEGVRQILDEMVYNLVENAIKYNKDGGSVTVTVDVGDAGPRLAVADTGIGIPYQSQNRVFERFYRVDKSHSKEVGGTGLGLSIVKHGAIYHDARVSLQSEPDRGTTVTIDF